MAIARSSFYAATRQLTDEATIIAAMTAIADAFEAYGYRRMTEELRHRGLLVNSKKVRRLMREHA